MQILCSLTWTTFRSLCLPIRPRTNMISRFFWRFWHWPEHVLCFLLFHYGPERKQTRLYWWSSGVKFLVSQVWNNNEKTFSSFRAKRPHRSSPSRREKGTTGATDHDLQYDATMFALSLEWMKKGERTVSNRSIVGGPLTRFEPCLLSMCGPPTVYCYH